MAKKFTQEELDEMRQLREQGATYEEIGRMFGRSANSLMVKFSNLGWSNIGKAGLTPPLAPETITIKDDNGEDRRLVKHKTPLSEYQPRELIKYLYNLGYRIENNKLVYVHKQTINIKTILDD